MNQTHRRALADDDWASLALSVRAGNCVLMLGPDAVTDEVDGRPVPVMDTLAGFLAAKLGRPELASRPAAEVAQAVQAAKDVNTVRFWTLEFYRDRNLDSRALATLASLPFEVVVSAVPGAPVEQAFVAAGKQPLVAFYDFTGAAAPPAPTGSTARPLVYHLFGSTERPASLVVSESATLDFLVAAVSQSPALPSNLTSVLRARDTSFLFLGFRLHEWHLRTLLHALFRGSEGRVNRSFALEEIESPSGQVYWRSHKVDFFEMDVAQFAAKLAEQVGPVATAPVPATGPAPDAPMVFICHASEDKATARRLDEDLRARGIRVWIDEHQLRGGDRWDGSIRDVLGSEADYVVVVQTPSLVAKDVGYVNKEINLALDRHLEYRPPRVFLLPVSVDGAMLDHLGHIQSTDMTDWATGIEQLTSAIRRDVERARRELR